MKERERFVNYWCSLDDACVHGGVEHLEEGRAHDQEEEETQHDGPDGHPLILLLQTRVTSCFAYPQGSRHVLFINVLLIDLGLQLLSSVKSCLKDGGQGGYAGGCT